MCTSLRCLRAFAVCFFASVLAGAAHVASAATIVVDGTDDAAIPGLGDGVCTLREAMQSVTNAANFGDCIATGSYGTSDTINFGISGTGVHTISAAATLPAITKPVLIDGYSQAGATANTLAVGNDAQLKIRIDGGGLPVGADLFQIQGPVGGSTIRGLVISHVSGVGINVGASVDSHNNTIAGNFIGTDPTGTLFQGGGGSAVRFSGTSNTLGGPTLAARNVITANGGANAGVVLIYFGGNNLIQGNYIGVNADGTARLPPGGAFNAMELFLTTGNLIGGASAGLGNIIVGANIGIRLSQGANSTLVWGNFIGTDATGTAGLGGTYGISTDNGPNGILIGGPAAGAGNLISGNIYGINLQGGATSTLVQGNKIGTDVTGALPLPNQCGILMVTPGIGSTIGGTANGEGNLVAFNVENGVNVSSGSGWRISGNSIHSNGGLGISLRSSCAAGPPPIANDTGDGDAGNNDLQNYPVLNGLTLGANTATFSGTLNSTALQGFFVEFFSSPNCDASKHGEGKKFLGSIPVATDESGNVSFGPLAYTIAAGDRVITATATNNNGSTSEFSACLKPPSTLDIDGNTHYDPLTDGLLLLRNLFGLTGTSLISGAIGGGATRSLAPDIESYIAFVSGDFDVDGDGRTDALTDGLMIIRYLFGLRGASMVSGAVGTGATRTQAADIETYIQSLMP